MKANHKHYTLILISALTLIFSVGGYFIIYKIMMDQKEKGISAISAISLEDEKKLMEQELEKVYKSTKEDREFIYSLLIPEDKIVPFIEEIEKIGDYTKTEFNISSISSDTDNLKAHIESMGLWSNIMQTLLLIENMPYSVSINNIRLEGMDKDKWKLSLDIKALILK